MCTLYQRFVVGGISLLATGYNLHRAHADPCRDSYSHLRTPITLGPEGADFGAATSACASQHLGLDLRAGAAIAAKAPDFYANLSASALLSGTWALNDSIWFTAAADTRYDYVVNASVVASEAIFGPATMAMHGRVFSCSRIQLAIFGRILLPLDTGYANAVRAGIEPGMAGTWMLNKRFTLYPSQSFPLTNTWLGARSTPRVTSRTTVDIGLAAAKWFEVLAGMETRVTPDSEGWFETAVARFGARFVLGRGVDIHLEARVPFAGVVRTPMRFALGAAIHF